MTMLPPGADPGLVHGHTAVAEAEAVEIGAGGPLTAIVTLLGLSLPSLVAGAIFVEVVFNYPGMGLAFFQAATNFDFPTLLGFTIIATVATILGNLLADVGYALLDPRVRY